MFPKNKDNNFLLFFDKIQRIRVDGVLVVELILKEDKIFVETPLGDGESWSC